MTEHKRTLGDWLHYAEKAFIKAKLYFGHGTDNAWDEAVALCLHALSLPADTGQEALTLTPSEEQASRIESLIKQRCESRLPLAYLTHEAFFCGLPFYINEHVLIPRSPIAELIENQFSPWIPAQDIKTLLEIGTGSGCIAIACALALPETQVVATDLSDEALKVAEKNIQHYDLSGRVKLLKADLFQTIPKQAFDVIVSNPPYVDQQDMENLPKEYLHEPRLALYGGQDGLDLVKQILKQAKDYLSEKGILIIEVGNSEEALIEQFPHLPFIWLEFERGGGGVFLLQAQDLHQAEFSW